MLCAAYSLTYPHQETLWVVLLDRKNHPLFRIMVTKGTLTGSLVSPREVFTPALLAGAATVIVAHNHPSGDPSPSSADIQVTRALKDAGRILNVELTDHIIVLSERSDKTTYAECRIIPSWRR